MCEWRPRGNFNSRPSARGDHQQSDFWLRSKISIHAPPRGATNALALSSTLGEISIHAPPRGATWGASCNPCAVQDFNSRPSARGDDPSIIIIDISEISIHAPPRGATDLSPAEMMWQYISIHAPPRGATTTLSVTASCLPFQFTPLREGRPVCFDIACDSRHFNSRPSARGDCIVLFRRSVTPHFNSRPSARGDPRGGATAKDMQFLQIFCSTLTNQHGLTIVPRNLSRLFW